MSTAVMLVLSIAAMVALACRVDPLSWRTHPRAMLANMVAASAAGWSLHSAAEGRASLPAGLALAAVLLWLLLTFRQSIRTRAAACPTN